MKMRLITLVLMAAVSGCSMMGPTGPKPDALNPGETRSASTKYRDQRLVAPINLNLGNNFNHLPKGRILPGMVGIWSSDAMEFGQTGQFSSPGLVAIYNDGTGEFATQHPSCHHQMRYLTTYEDGTVVYGKLGNGNFVHCSKGFVRIQPRADGTLRVSEHQMSPKGAEVRAAIFVRKAK